MTGPLLAEATAQLAAAGIATPRVDAELLLAAALGVPRTRLPTRDDVPPAAVDLFATYVGRRAAREPLQHIVGKAPFRQLEIPVGPGVFIPRPETELLVDAVLPTLRATPRPLAVDLCSGSGAIALAIADEVPAARVIGVERPGPSGDWFRRNTAGSRVEAVIGDVTDPDLLVAVRGVADALVCNPPYVPAATAIAAEVHHDPAEAVFAGADGLALIPHVVARAAELLRPGGILALEHDETQAGTAVALLEHDGRFTRIADHPDLTGRPRYALATRR